MIAPTSSAAKTNSGMSGWPVERPSARASARPSILYLRESVRKAGAADGMAARAIPRHQQLATSRGRGGLLCRDRRSGAHDDDHDEIIESLPAHMLFACSPVPHGRIGVTTKSKMGSPALIWLKSATRRLDGRYRIAQDGLESATFGSRIPAIKAMRTRSERLAACVFIIRLAR